MTSLGANTGIMNEIFNLIEMKEGTPGKIEQYQIVL